MTTYANYITVDGKIYYPDRPVIEAFHEAVAQLAEAQAKLQEAEQKNKDIRKLLRKASGDMSYGHWSSDFRNQVERALK